MTNQMKFTTCFVFISLCLFSTAQTEEFIEDKSFFITPEISLGKTLEANRRFPKSNLQSAVLVNLGWHNKKDKAWAQRLGYPKTGVTLGYTDFGNSEKLGQAYSLIPFAEFDIKKRLHLNIGMGVSYMNTLYDVNTNRFNRAITTALNWSFRSFLHYDFHATERLEWRFGLGYFHHSNGHTRLPNQGLNSLLASISTKINSHTKQKVIQPPTVQKSAQTYMSARGDFGINVLSEEFSDKKPVYTFAISAGKIINKTFKIGGGFYYRFYQHYYDYIKNEEELVETLYPIFKEHPFRYATNFGLFGTVELLLGHVGFEFDMGLNIYKPAYKIDWILNQGNTYYNNADDFVRELGELDSYYELKRTISSRLGLKYYLVNTALVPKHNWFVGAHINANLGQADFTGFSLGYVYRFDKISDN